MGKKIIIISAVSFFEGGPLSVLKDCLAELDKNFTKDYIVLALTFVNLNDQYPHIHFITFPQARKSYLHRFYLEYSFFNKIAKKLKPHLWISLHDLTPNVGSTQQVVYCHNPSPFYNLSWKEFLFAPKFVLFHYFYKLFYQINIHRNKYVIVQQNWLRNTFHEKFSLATTGIIVAHPDRPEELNINEISKYDSSQPQDDTIYFFYPTFPRVFKNIEIIGEAIKILNGYSLKKDYRVIVTISGKENAYAKWLRRRYNQEQLVLIGKQSREKVFEFYQQCHALIFPSKLETWGLPLSEFKFTNKPILASNLPYAKESVGEYEKVTFFNPNNAEELAFNMSQIINEKIVWEPTKEIVYANPYTKSWFKLLNLILQ